MFTRTRSRDVPVRFAGSDPLDALNTVIERFESVGRNALHRQYIRRSRARPTDLLLAAALAADATRFGSLEAGELDFPGFIAAVERTGMSESAIGDRSEEELRGLLTAVRGAVGEQWVFEGLHGGSLPTPPGTSRIDLLPFHTPGVDLQFTGSNGQMVATANVKIAKSAQVIVEHFAQHSNVNLVYASTDAAEHAEKLGLKVVDTLDVLDPGHHTVIDIGRSSRDFDRELSWATDRSVQHSSAGDALSSLPWFALTAIAVRAILRLHRRQHPAAVVRRAAEEGGVVGGSAAVTSVVSKVTASEPILMATAFLGSAFGFGILRGRESWSSAGNVIEQSACHAESLALRYGTGLKDG